MNTDYVDTHYPYPAGGYQNTTSQSKTLSGNNCFFPATSDDQPYGGHVIVQAVARLANSCNGGVTGTLIFDIWGVNQNNQAQLKPDADDYNSSILNGAGWFLPYLIGYESFDVTADITGVQFKPSNGHPLWGSPDGRGVMQVDRTELPGDFTDQGPYWNFDTNLYDGITHLAVLQQYSGGDCNTNLGEVTNGDCQHYAYDFWDRQVYQACKQSGGSSTPVRSGGLGTEYCNVPIPSAPTLNYTYCQFSYPQTTANHYRDAEWIQTYNGAPCGYYIIWDNSIQPNGGWSIRETQTCSLGSFSYDKRVCTTPPAYQ